MELKRMLPIAKDIERCEIVGHVTNSTWGPDFDPFVELYGADVYKSRVLMSLEKATYADSMGIQWLLAANQRFEQNGGRLVLHSANPSTRKLLQIMRMNLVLSIAKDADEARNLMEQTTSEQGQKNG